jgi:hypothetical protein
MGLVDMGAWADLEPVHAERAANQDGCGYCTRHLDGQIHDRHYIKWPDDRGCVVYCCEGCQRLALLAHVTGLRIPVKAAEPLMRRGLRRRSLADRQHVR